MTRRVANPGLARLLATKDAPDERFAVADLGCLASVSPRSIHRYSTGRKRLPRVEAKIARVFNLSIPELRRRLGLPSSDNPTGGTP